MEEEALKRAAKRSTRQLTMAGPAHGEVGEDNDDYTGCFTTRTTVWIWLNSWMRVPWVQSQVLMLDNGLSQSCSTIFMQWLTYFVARFQELPAALKRILCQVHSRTGVFCYHHLGSRYEARSTSFRLKVQLLTLLEFSAFI